MIVTLGQPRVLLATGEIEAEQLTPEVLKALEQRMEDLQKTLRRPGGGLLSIQKKLQNRKESLRAGLPADSID